MVSAVVSVNATTPNGPLAGQPIVFAFKLSSAGSYGGQTTVTTDPNGNASFTFTGLSAPAVYNFQVTYAGNTVYESAQQVVNLDTTAATVTTTLTETATWVDSTNATVSGTLTSTSGNVFGAAVAVSVDGNLLTSTTTDTSGNYSFTLSGLSSTVQHTVGVSYAGSGTYLPTSATATLTPPTAGITAVPLGVVGMLAVAGVIGAVIVVGPGKKWFRGRRHRR